MSYIYLAIIAYLILALVNLADKALLDKVLPSSKTYTFLVSLLGGAVFVAYPWYGAWPGWSLFFINILVGAIFPLGLLLLYQALKTGEASKILVISGSSVPIFTVVMAYFFLGERFNFHQWLGITGLIVGTAIIAWLPAKENWIKRVSHWLGFGAADQAVGIAEAVGAGLLFAIFFTASKFLYTAQSFFSAFIWLRLGAVLVALLFLVHKASRREIFKSLKNLHGGKAGLFFANQSVAAIGFGLQNYALYLGSAAIVNSMQGVQYAFLLILGATLTIFAPKVIKENISTTIIIQKLIAITLIGLSLFVLATS
ncbi:MAG: DMT family transporter [Patescibacteria group bacterium]|nr:DMT family transporter [Patescibacteria group bacterium]